MAQIMGVASHIAAASPNGPRYDAGMSTKTRGAIENAIWLCEWCSTLIDKDSGRYDVTLLSAWKNLAEASALSAIQGGASSPLAKSTDAELIKFYSQCFFRPAFQDPFKQEASFEAFDKAMEDTVTAINTGCSRLRDGTLVMQAQGIMFLENIAWRQRMEAIVGLIRLIRARFAQAVQNKTISISNNFYCVYDQSLQHWMDDTRVQVLQLFAEICREANIQPPRIDVLSSRIRGTSATVASEKPASKRASPQLPDSMLVPTSFLHLFFHDIRSPLAAIGGAAWSMGRENDTAMRERRYHEIRHYLVSISSLLEMVKWSIGYKFPRQHTQASLLKSDILNPVLKMLTHPLAERGFVHSQIHTSGFESVPKVHIDVDAFKLALFAIIENGVKFSIPKSDDFRVVIRAHFDGAKIKISVSDWGVGIVPSEVDEIFDPGFKSRMTLHNEVRGSGLGLYVAKSIVNAHGGEIHVVSVSNPTEFVIELPSSITHPPASR